MINRSMGGRPPPPDSTGHVRPSQPRRPSSRATVGGVADDPRVLEHVEAGRELSTEVDGLVAQGVEVGGGGEVHARIVAHPADLSVLGGNRGAGAPRFPPKTRAT